MCVDPVVHLLDGKMPLDGQEGEEVRSGQANDGADVGTSERLDVLASDLSDSQQSTMEIREMRYSDLTESDLRALRDELGDVIEIGLKEAGQLVQEVCARILVVCVYVRVCVCVRRVPPTGDACVDSVRMRAILRENGTRAVATQGMEAVEAYSKSKDELPGDLKTKAPIIVLANTTPTPPRLPSSTPPAAATHAGRQSSGDAGVSSPGGAGAGVHGGRARSVEAEQEPAALDRRKSAERVRSQSSNNLLETVCAEAKGSKIGGLKSSKSFHVVDGHVISHAQRRKLRTQGIAALVGKPKPETRNPKSETRNLKS